MSKHLSTNRLDIAGILVSRAQTQPDQTAVYVEHSHQTGGDVLSRFLPVSYLELLNRASGVVSQIQNTLTKKGMERPRLLVMQEPGLEFVVSFFACLLADMIAVPIQIPRVFDQSIEETDLQRIRLILKDAEPSAILTSQRLSQRLAFTGIPVISTEDVEGGAVDFKGRLHGQDALALIQYTSGSTGRPKGVSVTFNNLQHNLDQIAYRFGHNADSRGVIWLPPFHDMGLIGGILQPIHVGFPVALMSPVSFIRNPRRWLEAINAFRATTSGGPTFAYDFAVKKVNAENLKDLDLSSWKVAFVGAEAVRKPILSRFAEKFAQCGFNESTFLPCYGLAESTLMAAANHPGRGIKESEGPQTGLHQNDENASLDRFVSCGVSMDDSNLKIVDPGSREILGEHATGEIWLSGPSVAKGYWGQENAAENPFHGQLKEDVSGQHYLRTGDLGFLLNNELYVCGRIKDLIVIRGQNYLPADLEYAAAEAVSMEPDSLAAFSIDEEAGEKVVLLVEISKRQQDQYDHQDISARIRQRLSQQFGVRIDVIAAVAQRMLHRTSSGKLRRHACRNDYLNDKMPSLETSRLNDSTDLTQSGVETQDESLQSWITQMLARQLNVEHSTISADRPLAELGVDSVMAVEMAEALTRKLHLTKPLDPTLAWRYPTIWALSAHLSPINHNIKSGETPRLERACTKISTTDPIAIVGMSCRFPGANTPEAFWKLLKDGQDSISNVPSDRWDVSCHYDANPETPGKMYTKAGGFIENVTDFDPEFFGISPREAAHMDPQQRFLLEAAYLALKDAGLDPFSLRESRTGVYVGLGSDDYAQLSLRSGDLTNVHQHSALGSMRGIAAGRIAYVFGFNGPSIQLDTTCSSSLVSVHLACQALRNGEADLALAGGVNLMLSPESTIACCKLHALSPEGKCFAFGAQADGYVRGEGCGMIALQPLSQALQQGREIYAIIRGSAVNHDGQSNGLTAPNVNSQITLIRRALDTAGLSPDQIDYVEAHGTGTPLGDPIELQALSEVFQKRSAPLPIGSVKTNIGHLESAAGIASLIKTVISMQHGLLPGHLNASELTPHVDWSQNGLLVPALTESWPSDQPVRRAGVSSFGMSGTNAHLIVERPKDGPLRVPWSEAEIRSGNSNDPFNRRRCWMDDVDTHPSSQTLELHRLNLAGDAVHVFEGSLCFNDWDDHQIEGQTIFPATGHLWFFANVMSQLKSSGVLRDVRFLNPLSIPKTGAELQIHSAQERSGLRQIHLYDKTHETWRLSSQASAEELDASDEISPSHVWSYDQSDAKELSVEDIYSAFTQRGIQYGSRFRCLSNIRRCKNFIHAALENPVAGPNQLIAGLDAGLQLTGLLFDDGKYLKVPASIEAFRLDQAIASKENVNLEILAWIKNGRANIQWKTGKQQIIAELLGLQVAVLQEVSTNDDAIPLFEIEWKTEPLGMASAQVFHPPNRIRKEIANSSKHLRDTYEKSSERVSLDSLNALAVHYIREALTDFNPDEIQDTQKTYFRHLQSIAAGQIDQSFDRDGESIETTLIRRCGKHLRLVLRGEKDPLSVLFPEGDMSLLTALYEESYWAKWMNGVLCEAIRIGIKSVPNRPLRILEIGAGTGGTTVHVLKLLQSIGCEVGYVFTDVSHHFLAEGRRRLESFAGIKCELLDIERPPKEQGISGDFDLVIASNVIHATRNISDSLSHIRELLAPAGQIILLEITDSMVWLDLVFGMTDGWWRFSDHELRPDHPLMNVDQWIGVCEQVGFSEVVPLGGSVIVASEPAKSVRVPTSTTYSPDAFVDRQLPYEKGEGHCIIRLPEMTADMELDFGIVCEVVCISLLRTIQSLLNESNPCRLYICAPGLHDGDDILVGSIWGMVQTMDLEHPEFDATLLIGGDTEQIKSEILSNNREKRVDLRNDQRRVARCVEIQSAEEASQQKRLVPGKEKTIDSLSWDFLPAQDFPPDHLEIEVQAAGLNFRDVLVAVGLYPEQADLGCEFTGVVKSVGDLVTDLQSGDRVVGFASGCFSSSVITSRKLVVSLPDGISFENGASMPVAFGTAYHCLKNIAGLKAGETVLIHSATGGVGQAAVRIAQALGAEVFATSSRSKWNHLQSMGIAQPMDSRTLEFGDLIRDHTNGRGVDIVLSALPGEARKCSLDTLSLGGRFVEIGKGEGLSPEEMKRARPDIQHTVFDLAALCREAPDEVQTLLSRVISGVQSRDWGNTDVRIVDWQEITEAFRSMHLGKHIGKWVARRSSMPPTFHEETVVLITGGLGGLGLLVADWFVKKGVNHLVLLSRQGLIDRTRREAVEGLRKQGVRVDILQADLADKKQLTEKLAPYLEEHSKTPLHGVVHAAGVLADGLMQHQKADNIAKVFAPKVRGAWNLHALTLEAKLEFFVMFSSATGTFGGPGQINHAAANSFMDELARHRKTTGLSGLSIAWGPWSEVGAAVGYADGDSLRAIPGIRMIDPEQGMHLMDALWNHTKPTVTVIPMDTAQFDWKRWGASLGLGIETERSPESKLSPDSSEPSIDPKNFSDKRDLENHLRSRVAAVLGFKRDELDMKKGFFDLGLDSLTALELKKTLERDLGTELSTTVAFDYPTPEALSQFLASKVFKPKEERIATNDDQSHIAEQLDAKLDELDRLLGDESSELK